MKKLQIWTIHPKGLPTALVVRSATQFPSVSSGKTPEVALQRSTTTVLPGVSAAIAGVGMTGATENRDAAANMAVTRFIEFLH
jgi:hypothetical protein